MFMHLTVLCCCFAAVLWFINIVVYSLSSCYKLTVLREQLQLDWSRSTCVFVYWKRQYHLKTYIPSTVSQDGLKQLMLLNTESNLLKELSSCTSLTSDMIDRFAAMKDRHQNLIYKK